MAPVPVSTRYSVTIFTRWSSLPPSRKWRLPMIKNPERCLSRRLQHRPELRRSNEFRKTASGLPNHAEADSVVRSHSRFSRRAQSLGALRRPPLLSLGIWTHRSTRLREHRVPGRPSSGARSYVGVPSIRENWMDSSTSWALSFLP